MPHKDVYFLEQVDEWLELSKGWDNLKKWQSYVFSRRQEYFSGRQRSLGAEYHFSPQQWDNVFEREWTVMEERLKAGIGVDTFLLDDLGSDFFVENDALLQEIADLESELDMEETEEGNTLVVYTLEDFVMLSNQGIFRDSVFILDPQRKWRKKVENLVRSYGYDSIERIKIREVNYLVVSKTEV
tara:strand:+ start:1023 stop:1577 length:555 start_codon:yes stop_codon:yes gene_type:complete